MLRGVSYRGGTDEFGDFVVDFGEDVDEGEEGLVIVQGKGLRGDK